MTIVRSIGKRSHSYRNKGNKYHQHSGTGSENSSSSGKKVFKKDEGEYVDYEEIE